MARGLASDSDEENGPDDDERDGRGKHGACSAGRTPGRTESDDERDKDDRFDSMCPDAQLRATDGDRKALRPPEDELQRSGEDDQPERVRRADVLRREEQPDQIRREPEQQRHGNENTGSGAERVTTDTCKHRGARAPLPRSGLLGQQDQPRRRRECGESLLRRLGDTEVPDLVGRRDDTQQQWAQGASQGDDAGRQAGLEDEAGDLRALLADRNGGHARIASERRPAGGEHGRRRQNLRHDDGRDRLGEPVARPDRDRSKS